MTSSTTGSLLDLRLKDFLAEVASAAPAPGGGVVAGVTLAAAAGLVAMVGRHSPHLDRAAEVIDEADALRARASHLAARDGEVYAAVLDAADRVRRREALAAATAVPLDIVQIAARVAELSERVARDGNPNLQGDALTGLLLADAAARSARYLVRLNSQAGDLGPEAADQARDWCDQVAARVTAWETTDGPGTGATTTEDPPWV